MNAMNDYLKKKRKRKRVLYSCSHSSGIKPLVMHDICFFGSLIIPYTYKPMPYVPVLVPRPIYFCVVERALQ